MNVELKNISYSSTTNGKTENVVKDTNITTVGINQARSDNLPTELKEVAQNAGLKEATDPENLPQNLSERMNDVAMDVLPENDNHRPNSSLFLSMSNFLTSKLFWSNPVVKTTIEKEKSIEECLENWVVLDDSCELEMNKSLDKLEVLEVESANIEDSKEFEVQYDEEGYIIYEPIYENVNYDQIKINFDVDEAIINEEYDNLIEENLSEESQVVDLDEKGKEVEETTEEKKLRKNKEAAVTKIMLGASGIGGAVGTLGIGGTTVETLGGIWLYTQTAKNSYVVSSYFLQYIAANGAATAVSAIANVTVLGVSVVTLGNVAAVGSSVYLAAKLGQLGYNKVFIEKEEEKINITTKTIVTSIAGKVLGS